MRFRKIYLLIVIFLSSFSLYAQKPDSIPFFQHYPGSVEGNLKYYYTNFMDVKGTDGKKLRKAVGEYWRKNIKLDTLKVDNYKSKELFLEQLKDLNAKLYFQDDKTVYFSFVKDRIFYWGKFFSKEYRNYSVTLIREKPLKKKVKFYSDEPIVYGEFTAEMPPPPIIRPFEGSVAVQGKFSKYNLLEFTYVKDEKRYKKTAGGRFWDYKFEVRNKENVKDILVSKFELKENYFNEIIVNNCEVIKDVGFLLTFNIPADGFKVWCRLLASLDGVYHLKIVQEMEEDYTPPVELN